MKQVRMWMSFNDEAERELSAEFSGEDIRVLEMFRSHVETLRETKIISESWPSRTQFRWDAKAGTRIETDEIDPEFLSSFLHCLRPIVLHEEPASFNTISGLISRRFAHKSMKRHLKAVRAAFETSNFARYGQVTIANIPIFDERTLKKWLNAFEYHQDLEKRQELKVLESAFSRQEVRTMFVLQMKDRCDGIFLLDDMCQFILEC